MGGAIALAVGLVSSYTFYRLKDSEDLRGWERRLLRPAGYLLVGLFLGLSVFLFGTIGVGLLDA